MLASVAAASGGTGCCRQPSGSRCGASKDANCERAPSAANATEYGSVASHTYKSNVVMSSGAHRCPYTLSLIARIADGRL